MQLLAAFKTDRFSKEHADIFDVIKIEIRKEPYWNRMINTQEKLEAWVEEIRETKNLWS